MERALSVVTVAVLLSVAPAGAGGVLGPVSIAAGFGSVWVGTGTGEIVRLDEQRGAEKGRIAGRSTEFVHGLSAAYGSVWALRGRLTRIDPQTLRTRDVHGVGSATAFTVAAAAGALWIVDDGANAVTRIDPRGARAVATLHVPGRAVGLAGGGKNAFVVTVPHAGAVTGPSGPRLIRRVEPAKGRVSEPLVDVDCDQALAVGRSALWTLDLCTNALVRRDLPNLRRTAAITIPRASALALGFGSVWAVAGNRVVRVDPAKMRVVARIAARGTLVAVGRDAVWALSVGNGIRGLVTKIDPRTNRTVGRPIPVSPS